MTTTFEYASSKLGAVKPATKAKAKEIFYAAQKAGHEIWFMWGMGAGEHSSGTALDLMVRNRTAGDWVRNYIWANRARLQLRHVIWEQHITSTVVSPGVRRPMADRGSTTANHYDHNHVLFFDNDKAYVPPAAPAPAPAPAPSTATVRTLYYREGNVMVGTDVKRLQAGLKAQFPLYAGSLVVDSRFGPATDRAVREFQKRSNLTVDGKVGPSTRAELGKYGIKLY